MGICDPLLSPPIPARASGSLHLDQVTISNANLDLLSPTFDNYATLLRQCSSLSYGKRLHARMLESGLLARNVVLNNLVIQMYGKCGSSRDSKAAFDSSAERNVFSWTILIASFAQNGDLAAAITFFRKMDCEGMKPNEITLITILGVLASQKNITEARALHARIVRTTFHSHCQVIAAVIHVYGRCGCPRDARQAFDSLSPGKRNVVAWNTIIAAYAQSGQTADAFSLYHEMCGPDSPVRPTSVTFLNILAACAGPADLAMGRAVHDRIPGWENDVMVGTAVVSMYGRCGAAGAARAAFRAMQARNVVSWNAAIAANAQNGHGAAAIALFREMSVEGFKPNAVTLASALEGCAFAGALQEGRSIHSLMIPSPMTSEAEIVLWTSLLNMYAKCGAIDAAEGVFRDMAYKNVITWNTLLAAYAQKGHVWEAETTLAAMLLEGARPNPITFVIVLYAYSHAGRLAMALQCFGLMLQDHGVAPDVEHFGCIVDLLGRAGWLTEAEDVIKLMPLKDDAVWLALLNGCKMHQDSQRGAQAAGRVFHMELKDSAPYVLLSSIQSKQ